MYRFLLSGAAMAVLVVSFVAPLVLAEEGTEAAKLEQSQVEEEATAAVPATEEGTEAATLEQSQVEEEAPAAVSYERDYYRRHATRVDPIRDRRLAQLDARRRAMDAERRARRWWKDPWRESYREQRDMWYDFDRGMRDEKCARIRDWIEGQRDYMTGYEPFRPIGGYGAPYRRAPYGFGGRPWW